MNAFSRMRSRSATVPMPRRVASTPQRRRRWPPPWIFRGAPLALPYALSPASDPVSEPEPQVDAADSGAPPEEEAKRPGTVATLSWSGPYSLTTYKPSVGSLPKGGGLYIVADASAAPTSSSLYVGEAGSFLTRWRARLREAYEAGLIDRTLARPITVYCASISSSSLITEKERKTLEWVVVRVLLEGGLSLRNETAFRPFKTLTQMDVVNVLPDAIRAKLQAPAQGSAAFRPDAPQVIATVKASNRFTRTAGSVFEAEFYAARGLG